MGTRRPPLKTSIIGTRFRARPVGSGEWVAFEGPGGLPALLSREEVPSGPIHPDGLIEVEVVGINHERGWLLVRPTGR